MRQPQFASAGWTQRDVEDLLFWGVLGVVIGGRVGYAIFYKSAQYLHNPLEILMVWKGGMSFHGGLLGVIAAMAPGSALGALPDLAQLAYVPAALIGAACGLRLFRGLTDRQFRRAVNILLIAAGVGMVV